MRTTFALCVAVAASLAFSTTARAQAPAPAAKPAAAPEVKAEEKVPDPTLSTLQGRVLQPEKVSARVREALRRKMRSHSKDFTHLPMAIVFANYAEVTRATQGIMNEPRIDKTTLGDEQAGLSDYFFTLQAELRERAQALNKAAAERDVAVMTTAMGKLTETCATCHLVYREPMMKKGEAGK